jgi:hypothetical protein
VDSFVAGWGISFVNVWDAQCHRKAPVGLGIGPHMAKVGNVDFRLISDGENPIGNLVGAEKGKHPKFHREHCIGSWYARQSGR